MDPRNLFSLLSLSKLASSSQLLYIITASH